LLCFIFPKFKNYIYIRFGFWGRLQDEFREKILQKLEENYGLLYLSDHSSPEEIKEELEMSKKYFKKAI